MRTMKKLLAFLMCLCLLASCGAWAEDVEIDLADDIVPEVEAGPADEAVVESDEFSLLDGSQALSGEEYARENEFETGSVDMPRIDAPEQADESRIETAGPELDPNVPQANGSGVYINATNFPDAAFRSFIWDYDCNQDGYLTEYQLQNVTGLYVSGMGITSLKGIEFFPNLTELSCNDNTIRKLDLRKNTKLVKVLCNWNNMKTLRVDDCKQLSYLDCGNNSLKKLDLDDNENLETLYCYRNKLKELDVHHCKKLKVLVCHNNKLNQLKLYYCKKMTDLQCYNNQLEKLDVGDCVELKLLYCENNRLKELDTHHCKKLERLNCSKNKLKKLRVSNCKKLYWIKCGANKLEKMELEDNVALTHLICNSNRLKKLDMGKNVKLQYLNCDFNDLEKLKLKNNGKLYYLTCGGNKLEKLDLSNNFKLEELHCAGNKLKKVKLGKCSKLSYAAFIGNKLKSIDISQCAKLKKLVKLTPKFKKVLIIGEKKFPIVQWEYTDAWGCFKVDESTKVMNGDTCLYPIKPAKVEITTGTKATMLLGDKLTLAAKITPSNANYDYKTTWSSSNKNVATVSSKGLVTAKKAGTAKITIKTANGKTARITITVKKKGAKLTEDELRELYLRKAKAIKKKEEYESIRVRSLDLTGDGVIEEIVKYEHYNPVYGGFVVLTYRDGKIKTLFDSCSYMGTSGSYYSQTGALVCDGGGHEEDYRGVYVYRNGKFQLVAYKVVSNLMADEDYEYYYDAKYNDISKERYIALTKDLLQGKKTGL